MLLVCASYNHHIVSRTGQLHVYSILRVTRGWMPISSSLWMSSTMKYLLYYPPNSRGVSHKWSCFLPCLNTSASWYAAAWQLRTRLLWHWKHASWDIFCAWTVWDLCVWGGRNKRLHKRLACILSNLASVPETEVLKKWMVMTRTWMVAELQNAQW